jgi:hypothetical protein
LPSPIITAVAIDNSTDPGTIFAGTAYARVLVSQGSESNWAPFNCALVNLSITGFVISVGLPKIFFTVTFYGGVWRRALDACQCDFDGDSDVDGSDLVEYIPDDKRLGLNSFAMDFGKHHCFQG